MGPEKGPIGCTAVAAVHLRTAATPIPFETMSVNKLCYYGFGMSSSPAAAVSRWTFAVTQLYQHLLDKSNPYKLWSRFVEEKKQNAGEIVSFHQLICSIESRFIFLQIYQGFSEREWKFKMLQNVPHQIVQSPARLGLPNPNSPSLQNPTPPKSSSQVPQSRLPNQQSNLSKATTTSSTLLPLLLPLSRAPMSSPSNGFPCIAFCGSLPTFLSSQTQSTTPVQPDSSPSTTKEILSLFTTLQTQLFEAVAELQEILDLQVLSRKSLVKSGQKIPQCFPFLTNLKKPNGFLTFWSMIILNIAAPKDQNQKMIWMILLNLSDILSYAHRISYTTFAPPEFGAGQGPLRGALPPASQKEQLRASQLYAFADLNVGLPKSAESKEKTIEPFIEAPPAQQPDSNPLANLTGIQGLIPPNFVIPSGWKPGMPVELPSDLPMMPPHEWKPGEPVPLPPLDTLSVAGRIEEQQPRPIPAQGIPKVPEPIHVRHVEFDIDDDGSDYSSDMGSSDDED
ncbi:hypothetical protein ACSBR1_015877 [Camellia fascicularis]